MIREIQIDSTGKSAGCPAFLLRLNGGRGGRKRTPEVESKPTLYSYFHFPEAPPCGRGAALSLPWDSK